MEIVKIPVYKDIFPNEEVPELKDLLKNVPSHFALNVICFINAKNYLKQVKFDMQKNIFLAMIGRMPQDVQKEIIRSFDSFVEGLSEYQLSHLNIFALVGLLRFTEYEILNYRLGDFKNVSPEEELNVLKAILIFNGIIDEESTKIVIQRHKGPYQYSNENFYRMVWPNMIRQHEFNYSKDILKQLYLSILFFEYMDKHEKFNTFFKSYLTASITNEFIEYNRKLVELNIVSLNIEEGQYKSRFQPDLLEKNAVVKEFIIEPHNVAPEEYIARKDNVNFKGLRKWPIIRFEDGDFAIINWNFITDKLFQAFVFDFYNNSGISKKYSFNEFKSEIGDQFAQKSVFEGFMDKIFMDKGICLKDQNNLQNFDYYFRKDNKIVIFEFKDSLLNYNEEFNDILEDIDRKMVYEVHNDEIKKKSVYQLIDHLNKINEKYKEIDNFEKDGIDISRIIIYPVIVYTHEMWGMPGINDYLAERFAMERRKKKYQFFMIRELIMMDFDNFLDCFDSLKVGDLTIFQLLEKYYGDLALYRSLDKNSKSSIDIIQKFRTFDGALSPIKNKKCSFLNSSLYYELIEKLKLAEDKS